VLTSFNAGPASGYLFWDDVHPTAAAHVLLADQFLAVVAPGGISPPPNVLRGHDWLQRVRGKRTGPAR
jgi:hypothetical protein